MARASEKRFPALVLVCACALAASPGCAGRRAELGPWRPMTGRQFSVPLVAGTTVVEVHDATDGWTERVVVESDGREATGGVRDERPAAAEAPVDPARAALFRAKLGSAVDPAAPPFARAAAVREWVSRLTYGASYADTGEGMEKRRRARNGREPLMTDDGAAVLADVESGGNFNCASAAILFLDAARAVGLRARRVDLGVRAGVANEAHSVDEVWVEDADAAPTPRAAPPAPPGAPPSTPSAGQWVVMDPTFDCSFEVDGRSAGALDVHEAVAAGRLDRVRVVRDASAPGPDPRTFPIDPLLYYRNVEVLLGGGVRLGRFDARTPVGPVAGSTLRSDADAAFRTGGDALAEARVRRGDAGGRVAFQAIAGALYVCLADGLFEPGRFSARTAPGLDPEFAPSPPPLDPEDPAVFAAAELLGAARVGSAGGVAARNAGTAGNAATDAAGDRAAGSTTDTASDTARVIGAPGALPRGWRVEGDAAFEPAPEGGFVVETGGGCTLALDPVVAERIPVALFARLRVERGGATLALSTPRERDDAAAELGPARDVSTTILSTRRGELAVRLVFAPNTRCGVERVTLRRALTLAEAVGR